MTLFDRASAQKPEHHSGPSTAALDAVLTAQLAVAWAGEGGAEPRLGWWRCDMASEYGGEDLFRRLTPRTWAWAALQAALEAARRKDRELRLMSDDADRRISLYHLGFAIDERVSERLADLKRSGAAPLRALPGLADVIREDWNLEAFSRWLATHGGAEYQPTPAGRRLRGDMPEDPASAVRAMLSALQPLGAAYSLPHYRRDA